MHGTFHINSKICGSRKEDKVNFLFFFFRGDMSESEAEMDGPHNEVELPQDMKKGKFKATKSAVR